MKTNILFTLISAFVFTIQTNAASIRLSPVSIEMLDNQTATSINLYNQSSDSTDLQIRVFEWLQEDGKDLLKPTDDIVISPPFVKLAPTNSYNLRVVRIQPNTISGEKTYRIIVDELPKPVDSRKASQGLNVLLRSSLPVFIVNKDAITSITGSIQIDQNIPYVVINNTGSRHALLNELIVNDETAHTSFPIKVNTVNGYILSGKSKSYSILNNFNYQSGHKYTISATVNGKAMKF
ncbi:fimbrial biogenesis chaperone [Acinetobacter stercoris]|uniref:Pili assembly chaperone N-terminal domain-containing protein n=1 Tax=Acinetobacter stercoris TaxID=2126983 RepID=A0A2U3MVA8_9GAMM|nr:fimbria/pilus periplasmic chaperone [Acinetobacter stercoris]SPL69305.1 hypothetical protein KPC_0483 [Acinetobacter stercoris]